MTTDVSDVEAMANTVLYVVADRCEDDAERLACNDDLSDESELSEIRVDLTAEQVVFIVVDGFDTGEEGFSYALEVAFEGD